MASRDCAKVWIATTEYPARWSGDGFPELLTYIDGVASSEEVARAFSEWCSDVPVRWFRAKSYGKWIGGHRVGGDFHFHIVRGYAVAEGVNEWGQAE